MLNFVKQHYYSRTIFLVILLASMYTCQNYGYSVPEYEPCKEGYYRVARAEFINGKSQISHYCYQSLLKCEEYDLKTQNCLKCSKGLIFGLTKSSTGRIICAMHWYIYFVVALVGTLVVSALVYICIHLTQLRKENKAKERLEKEEDEAMLAEAQQTSQNINNVESTVNITPEKVVKNTNQFDNQEETHEMLESKLINDDDK